MKEPFSDIQQIVRKGLHSWNVNYQIALRAGIHNMTDEKQHSAYFVYLDVVTSDTPCKCHVSTNTYKNIDFKIQDFYLVSP